MLKPISNTPLLGKSIRRCQVVQSASSEFEGSVVTYGAITCAGLVPKDPKDKFMTFAQGESCVIEE